MLCCMGRLLTSVACVSVSSTLKLGSVLIAETMAMTASSTRRMGEKGSQNFLCVLPSGKAESNMPSIVVPRPKQSPVFSLSASRFSSKGWVNKKPRTRPSALRRSTHLAST